MTFQSGSIIKGHVNHCHKQAPSWYARRYWKQCSTPTMYQVSFPNSFQFSNLLFQFYLKSRLNCLLFKTDSLTPSSDNTQNRVKCSKESEELNSQEVDAIWESMPTVGSKRHKGHSESDSTNTIDSVQIEVAKKKKRLKKSTWSKLSVILRW